MHMDNKNANNLINEEMMRVDDSELLGMCHAIWVIYTGLINEGFSKQQAMSLVKEVVRPRLAS